MQRTKGASAAFIRELMRKAALFAADENPEITVEDLFWIGGTTRRWDGYNYFPQHPEHMIEWFDSMR